MLVTFVFMIMVSPDIFHPIREASHGPGRSSTILRVQNPGNKDIHGGAQEASFPLTVDPAVMPTDGLPLIGPQRPIPLGRRPWSRRI